jgi:hypothetical protein
MFRRFTKKRLLVLASITALAVAGIAYAFFSSTGTGDGSGSVANPTTTSAITVHGSTTGDLVPGGAQTVTFTADNSSGSPLRLGTIHLVSVTPDASHTACTQALGGFAMSDVPVNADIPSGNTNSVTPTGSLTMGNTGNQDDCKDADLTLAFSTN